MQSFTVFLTVSGLPNPGHQSRPCNCSGYHRIPEILEFRARFAVVRAKAMILAGEGDNRMAGWPMETITGGIASRGPVHERDLFLGEKR